MAVTRGLAKPVERVMVCWPFHLPMQTQELQSARMEYSSGLRTATATPRTTPEPQAHAAHSSDAVALIAATLREVSVRLARRVGGRALPNVVGFRAQVTVVIVLPRVGILCGL